MCSAESPRADVLTFAITSRPGEVDKVDFDHTVMPFAGRFGRRRTGTAILRDGDTIVAALAFSPDRAIEASCRIRHVGVHRDRQGAGLGVALLTHFRDWALERFAAIRVGADTPYAAVAYHRAGYAYTGERGPRGEVVFAAPPPPDAAHLTDAMAALLTRDLPEEQRRYAIERIDAAEDEFR